MLSSLANERIKKARRLLKAHYQDALFLLEGTHAVAEATRLGLIEDLFTTDEHLPGTLVSTQIMRALSDLPSLPTQVAVVRKPLQLPLTGRRILALDDVQDPGNVGTLIRTAVAFKFDAVIVRGANIFSQKVIRATQGAWLHINLVQVADLAPLLTNHFVIGATLNPSAFSLADVQVNLPESFVLVLGNEGHGLSAAVQALLSIEVTIATAFESLNVASAGAILMHSLKLSD